MAKGDLLFWDHDLRAVFEHQMRKLAEEIDSMPAARVLSTTPESWGDYFETKYRLEVPRLKEEEITVDQREDQIDVSRDFNRAISDRSRPFFMKETRFSCFVPFDGEPELFKCRPSTYTMNPPQAAIRGNELVLSYVPLGEATSVTIRAEFDRILGDIKGYLEWIERDLVPFSGSLRDTAVKRLEARRAKLLKDQSLVSGLGFALRRRDDVPTTYAVPTVRRKPAVSRPAPDKTRPAPPEPAVAMEEYEHILSVVANMVHVMERSPKAFAGMDEEALRQHFLVQLNGQYEGQASR